MTYSCHCGTRCATVTDLLRHSRLAHGVVTHRRDPQSGDAFVRYPKVMTDEAREIVEASQRAEVAA